MANPQVLVKRHWSIRDQAKALEHPGRQRQSAASWVTDLAELKKCVLLCGVCREHFNPKRYGYRRLYCDGYQIGGLTKCDGCKQAMGNVGGCGVAFVHEELYHQVSVDPAAARRKARLQWRRSGQLQAL